MNVLWTITERTVSECWTLCERWMRAHAERRIVNGEWMVNAHWTHSERRVSEPWTHPERTVNARWANDERKQKWESRTFQGLYNTCIICVHTEKKLSLFLYPITFFYSPLIFQKLKGVATPVMPPLDPPMTFIHDDVYACTGKGMDIDMSTFIIDLISLMVQIQSFG